MNFILVYAMMFEDVNVFIVLHKYSIILTFEILWS